jgi:hypothetical protein
MSGWGNTLARTVGRFRASSAEELNAIADQLEADAAAARRLREYQRHPDVVALNIERSRDRLDRAGWLLVIGGLLYTTVNVTLYVLGPPEKNEAGVPLPWAWWQVVPAGVVEPLMMGLLIIFLRGEQIAGRFGFTTGPWPKWTRWVALGFTYTMNTGSSWEELSPRGIFVHSIPVILVFLAAEALAHQRLVLTEVAEHASKLGSALLADSPTVPIIVQITPPPAPEPKVIPVVLTKPPAEPEPDPAPEPPREKKVPTGKRGRPRTADRIKLQEAYYLLRAKMPASAIRPVDVDNEAGVVGKAKKVMASLVKEYEQEHGQREEVRTNGEVVGASV